jgi:hypothetical protein
MVPALDPDTELLPLCDRLPELQPEEDSEALEETDALVEPDKEPEWL